MTPVFAHGQLRLYLLALLEPGPRHGYELITALSDRFGGTYRPSAGTIYPRLARLEEEGLVRRTEAGRKATYALTDAGRDELERRRGDLAEIEESIAETVRALADRVRSEVQGAMRGLRADLAAAAQEARAAATAPRPGGGTTWDPAVGSAGEGHTVAGHHGPAEGASPAAGGPHVEAPRTETSHRTRSLAALAEAEALLRSFRDDVRTDLRTAAARGGPIEQLTVDTVRTVLDQALSSIRATLPQQGGTRQ